MIRPLILALAIAIAGIAAAQAFNLGGLGRSAGKLGAAGGKGGVTPQPTGKLLAVDGVSFILQTDGVSKICRAGGC